jgi:hypothetical protein
MLAIGYRLLDQRTRIVGVRTVQEVVDLVSTCLLRAVPGQLVTRVPGTRTEEIWTHVGRHLAAQAEGGLARRDGKRLSEARALEFRHMPIGSGAQFGGEGIDGPERTLDRGAIGNRL